MRIFKPVAMVVLLVAAVVAFGFAGQYVLHEGADPPHRGSSMLDGCCPGHSTSAWTQHGNHEAHGEACELGDTDVDTPEAQAQ